MRYGAESPEGSMQTNRQPRLRGRIVSTRGRALTELNQLKLLIHGTRTTKMVALLLLVLCLSMRVVCC